MLGIVLASAVPAATAIYGHGVDRFTMGVLGWMIIVITPLSIWVAVQFVPEPRIVETARVDWLRQLTGLWANKPFRILCVAFFITNIGSSISTSTLVFFVTHYLQQPEVIGPVLLGSFTSVMAFVPIWVRIAQRIGKHRAAGISLIIAICITTAVAVALRPGDGWLFVAAVVVAGAASGGFLTLPLGMMGDIIDYDTLKTGTARGGIYFGIWSFAQKVSPALAIGFTLPVLAWIGFDPAAKSSNEGVEALRYVYALGSTPFFLIGAAMLWIFPIDARRHGIIRRRLDARTARAARGVSNETSGLHVPW